MTSKLGNGFLNKIQKATVIKEYIDIHDCIKIMNFSEVTKKFMKNSNKSIKKVNPTAKWGKGEQTKKQNPNGP